MGKVDFKTLSAHPSAEESPGFLLWRASTFWRRSIENVLIPMGLTHPQFVVLATIGWLTRNAKQVTQIEIAKEAALDPNTISQILRGLEAKNLIERLQLTDQRSKHAMLTAAGVRMLKKALPAVEKADAAFFSNVLPLKPETLHVLQNLAMPK